LRQLYGYGGYTLRFVFEVASVFDLGEVSMRAFVLTANTVCWGAIVGLLFGLPLGLLVQRPLPGYWILFVIAGIASQILIAAATGNNPGWVFANWTVPSEWVNMLAILGVALFTARRRGSTPNIEQNAA
jgi:hypothetical protein